jgi:hypothetical protein
MTFGAACSEVDGGDGVELNCWKVREEWPVDLIDGKPSSCRHGLRRRKDGEDGLSFPSIHDKRVMANRGLLALETGSEA